MSGLDDTGRIVQFCPLCEAWQVDADVSVLGWPLAGILVEDAIGEHVDECTSDPRVETMECGCVLRLDDRRNLARLTPCSFLHRQIAQTNRQPGSRIIVGQVPN